MWEGGARGGGKEGNRGGKQNGLIYRMLMDKVFDSFSAVLCGGDFRIVLSSWQQQL